MADLIDREELIKFLDKSFIEAFKNGDTRLLPNEVYELIRKIPPADTERHAHWVKKENKIPCCNSYGDAYFEYEDYFECSECGKKENVKHLYCRCGCKMDEEV